MKKELEQQLYKKYPILFIDKDKPDTESLMCYGCECGNGWYNLIDEACQKLVNYPIKFFQLKQKFAGLRIYHDPLTSFKVDPDIKKKISEIIFHIENKSYRTCEVCGNPGKVHIRGFWLKTLCSVCVSKDPYKEYKEYSREERDFSVHPASN